MSEDEAKTKWCPFVRNIQIRGDDPSLLTVTPAFNRVSVDDGDKLQKMNDVPDTCRCIGSACMAWRRNRDPDRIRAGISEYGGHCGLAGKP